MTRALPPHPALPPPHRAAFLLDLDGTLLDIAPTPESVVVAPGLAADLAALRDRVGGALAIVTGRPIAQIDALLPGVPHAVAGEHGGATRHAPGEPVRAAALADIPDAWRDAAARIAAAHPGARVEDKRRGIVLHYRAAPEHGASLRTALAALLAPAGDTPAGDPPAGDPPDSDAFHLLGAKMAWEIRPAGADKGSAVRALMARPPFAGRLPVFVGDDVTDEDGIAAAVALGGVGLRVPDTFGDPEGVRAWIARLANADPEGGGWPA